MMIVFINKDARFGARLLDDNFHKIMNHIVLNNTIIVSFMLK